MTKVNMHEAKTHLSKLVNQALEGEDIVLARSGKPLVRLVPVDAPSDQRPMGLHAMELSDEAAAESMRPLSDEDLGFWQDNDFPETDS